MIAIDDVQAADDSWPALRAPTGADSAGLQAVWAASQEEDDPAGRPYGGWWSITGWATESRVLPEDGAMIGLAAIEHRPGREVAEARVALVPTRRRPPAAERLIGATVHLAREAGAPLVRLYAPSSATWAAEPARRLGFREIRTLQVLLRPASAGRLAAPPIESARIRPLREGEEPALLAALNRAWDGTWNFRPITAEALHRDLRGQREGMLVAVDEADQTRIVATCHAMFDPADRNPDGQPYAWISNLTTDPAWRGRRLGRAMLAAGVDHLRRRGARSVALGVDGGDSIPLRLYRSAGFETISTTIVSERPTRKRTIT